MDNYSPLRYPGGKHALYPIVLNAIKLNKGNNKKIKQVYVEPFAGGAGVACKLLINNEIDLVIINDADKAVYSFWRTVMESPKWFIQKIQETPVNIDEWKKQRRVFLEGKYFSKELGFAMFYLNRTNRSGIINAGPIGGYSQEGTYKIDCRFNKAMLISKIETLAKYRHKVKVYNQDVFGFLERYLPRETDTQKVFIYFDPPYFEKGQRLYLNHFSKLDHMNLRNAVVELNCKWIMTYDDRPEINDLYSNFIRSHFAINYSLSNKSKGRELMICKDKSCIPTVDALSKLTHAVVFDEVAGGVVL